MGKGKGVCPDKRIRGREEHGIFRAVQVFILNRAETTSRQEQKMGPAGEKGLKTGAVMCHGGDIEVAFRFRRGSQPGIP